MATVTRVFASSIFIGSLLKSHSPFILIHSLSRYKNPLKCILVSKFPNKICKKVKVIFIELMTAFHFIVIRCKTHFTINIFPLMSKRNCKCN